MSDIPIRAIFLQTDLSTNNLMIQLANNETKTGLWQICVKDIAISFKEDHNQIGQIECNLVKDLKVNINNAQVQSYNPAICTFLIKGKLDEKKIFQFDKCWFQINAPNTEIKLNIRDAETKILITGQTTFFITILIQRIK
jgi:hypothetical protein